MCWYVHTLVDGSKVMACADPNEPPAKILLETEADFLGHLIPVIVTDRGLFAKNSAGWGWVERWEPESVPESLVTGHALR